MSSHIERETRYRRLPLLQKLHKILLPQLFYFICFNWEKNSQISKNQSEILSGAGDGKQKHTIVQLQKPMFNNASALGFSARLWYQTHRRQILARPNQRYNYIQSWILSEPFCWLLCFLFLLFSYIYLNFELGRVCAFKGAKLV